MARAMVETTVCDLCGKPASETLSFKNDGTSLQIDICSSDLRDLTSKAHAPRRGRPAGGAKAASGGAKSNGRRKAASRKSATAGRRPAKKRTATKRRTRSA